MLLHVRNMAGTLFIGLVLFLLACSRDSEHARVLVLGLDGLDPRAIELLVSEGMLPNFERLRRDGAYAPLISQKPLMSPVIWTTIATGKTPDQHGIGHFVAVNPQTGESLPVTSQLRRTRAIWNVASDAGRRVAVVGWWATWPAEKVLGSIVSDHLFYHFLFDQASRREGLSPGVTFPEELQERLVPLVTRPEDLGLDELRRYAKVGVQDLARPFDYHDDLSHLKWALAGARSHTKIGLHLWHEERPDLALVYVEGTDSVSHLFGHLFRAKELSGDLARQAERYGETAEQIYVLADRILGEFIEAMDERTTLLVLSDHGFDLGYLPVNPAMMGQLRRVRVEQHTLEGILYLYGNRVRPGAELKEPTILDFAPTVLALLGLPPARDMPGRILVEGLDVEVPHRVESYEDGSPRDAKPAHDPQVDPEILEHLRALGYLDTVSPESDRVMAGVLFEQHKYAESLEAYGDLLRQSPRDASLHVSIAGVLGMLERYEEALEHLDLASEIAPLDPAAHHNRGVIRERMGQIDEAIREYRTALRYRPGYEPARAALLELVGSAEPPLPATEAAQEADRLAEQAALAARRGDYAGAKRLLDRAQELAPDYALVYQYRSNVAYLMGDQQGAIEALERALELEPDNALYRENLRTLTERP